MIFLEIHHAWPFTTERILCCQWFSFLLFDFYVVPSLSTAEINLKNKLVNYISLYFIYFSGSLLVPILVDLLLVESS